MIVDKQVIERDRLAQLVDRSGRASLRPSLKERWPLAWLDRLLPRLTGMREKSQFGSCLGRPWLLTRIVMSMHGGHNYTRCFIVIIY